MSGNYEWQKFAANEQVKRRMRDGDAHRLARKARAAHEHDSKEQRGRLSPAIFLMGLALVAALWLLTGCMPDTRVNLVPSTATIGADQAAAEVEPQHLDVLQRPVTGLSMAERIQFQDKREAILAGTTVHTMQAQNGLSHAERIAFQDRRDQSLAPTTLSGR